MKKLNPIKDYMTKSPKTVGDDIALSKAVEIMREHKVRHLPVQSRGKLVGVLTERDINVAMSVHPTAVNLKVSDVMTEGPYSVTADCPLAQVAKEMATNKYGCAIVENEQGRAIGIFTAVDATELLADHLSAEEEPRRTIRLIS